MNLLETRDQLPLILYCSRPHRSLLVEVGTRAGNETEADQKSTDRKPHPLRNAKYT
jgi:hypothetical protein